jgi:hypothetical protein
LNVGASKQLHKIGLGSESVVVNNFELKRDAATFHFHRGTICFVAAVNGKVTGAVFVGDGETVPKPALAQRAGHAQAAQQTQ